MAKKYFLALCILIAALFGLQYCATHDCSGIYNNGICAER